MQPNVSTRRIRCRRKQSRACKNFWPSAPMQPERIARRNRPCAAGATDDVAPFNHLFQHGDCNVEESHHAPATASRTQRRCGGRPLQAEEIGRTPKRNAGRETVHPLLSTRSSQCRTKPPSACNCFSRLASMPLERIAARRNRSFGRKSFREKTVRPWEDRPFRGRSPFCLLWTPPLRAARMFLTAQPGIDRQSRVCRLR